MHMPDTTGADESIAAARSTANGNDVTLMETIKALEDGIVYEPQFWDAVDFSLGVLRALQSIPLKYVTIEPEVL